MCQVVVDVNLSHLGIHRVSFPLNRISATGAYMRPIPDRSIIGIQSDGVAVYVMSPADSVPSSNRVSCSNSFVSLFGGRLEHNGIQSKILTEGARSHWRSGIITCYLSDNTRFRSVGSHGFTHFSVESALTIVSQNISLTSFYLPFPCFTVGYLALILSSPQAIFRQTSGQ